MSSEISPDLPPFFSGVFDPKSMDLQTVLVFRNHEAGIMKLKREHLSNRRAGAVDLTRVAKINHLQIWPHWSPDKNHMRQARVGTRQGAIPILGIQLLQHQ